MSKILSSLKRITFPCTLLALFTVYVFVGLPHLGKFQTADEDLWFANPTEGRIHEYWRAMKYHTWEDTRINDKPGVTTAIFGGAFGLLFDKKPGEKMFDNDTIVDRFNPEYFEQASFFYRLGIYLINGILILVIAWLAFIITKSVWTSVLTGTFFFLSPILLGVSQIVNPDATLWSFGFATLLAYLAFVLRGKWYYLLLAGVFFGFALLSKYTGAILYFILFFLTFASFLYVGSSYKTQKQFATFVWTRLLGYGILVILSLGIFVLLMPAAIIEPKYLFEGTFGFKGASNVTGILTLMAWVWGVIFLEAVFMHSWISYRLVRILLVFRRPLASLVGAILLAGLLFALMSWSWGNTFNFEIAPFDAGRESEYRSIPSFWNKLSLQLKPIVFTLSPVVLLLSVAAWIFLPLLPNRFIKNPPDDKNTLLLVLVVFGVYIIAFFYAALTQSVLVHVRYSILLYPVIAFVAAIGGALVIERLMRIRTWIGLVAFLIILSWSGLSLAADRPYYFNYTNDLLPYDDDVVGAWGYGGYEAAKYLNSLTFSEYSIAWGDYEGFCPFFHGRCIKGSVIKWHKKGTFRGIDYFVVSRRGLIRNESTWRKLINEGIVDPKPLWTLYIGDRPGNFVEVYKKAESAL